MRNMVKAAAVAVAGGVLVLGASTSAYAAPPNLTGMGCPSSHSGNADGVRYVQTLKKKFVAGNGFLYGTYRVVYYPPNQGPPVSQPDREYRCY